MNSKTGPCDRASWSRGDWGGLTVLTVCSEHLVSVSQSQSGAASERMWTTPALQQHIKMSVYRGQVASPHSVTLVTLGDASVGKTSLINRFCSDTFNEVSCVGVSNKTIRPEIARPSDNNPPTTRTWLQWELMRNENGSVGWLVLSYVRLRELN